MRALDDMPEVEKTSLFGTAVHAVLRRAATPARSGRLAAPGSASTPSTRSLPSLEDVFLDVVENGGGRGMRKALAVYRKELRQILRDRRTLLILVFVPAFFLLLYGYALNFDIRHIALAVEDRDGTPESRRSSPRSSTRATSIWSRPSTPRLGIERPAGSQRGARRARHPEGFARRPAAARRPRRSSSTATTPTRRRP